MQVSKLNKKNRYIADFYDVVELVTETYLMYKLISE